MSAKKGQGDFVFVVTTEGGVPHLLRLRVLRETPCYYFVEEHRLVGRENYRLTKRDGRLGRTPDEALGRFVASTFRWSSWHRESLAEMDGWLRWATSEPEVEL